MKKIRWRKSLFWTVFLVPEGKESFMMGLHVKILQVWKQIQKTEKLHLCNHIWSIMRKCKFGKAHAWWHTSYNKAAPTKSQQNFNQLENFVFNNRTYVGHVLFIPLHAPVHCINFLGTLCHFSDSYFESEAFMNLGLVFSQQN